MARPAVYKGWRVVSGEKWRRDGAVVGGVQGGGGGGCGGGCGGGW